MKPKQILFKPEMVRAILDGRKSVMRRVVKPQPEQNISNDRYTFWWDRALERTYITPPYHPYQILYVRERWRVQSADRVEAAVKVEYMAGGLLTPLKLQGQEAFDAFVDKWADKKWHPSIHMPKEAARLFLRVTGVRVERLQDITVTGLQDEGLIKGGYLPQYTVMTNYDEHFSRWKELWDSTIKKADLPRYGWAANPWVWVIEFERISKEETQRSDKGL